MLVILIIMRTVPNESIGARLIMSAGRCQNGAVELIKI